MLAPPRPQRELFAQLRRSPEEIVTRFRSLATGHDVADLLEVENSQLHYITSRAQHLYPYHRFEIPKRNGLPRTILAPHRTVKILQRKLLRALSLVYRAHPAAHGFVPKHSILTNARPHQGKRFVLNVDLEDFFPSITFPRVRGVFMKRFQMPGAAATVLARICCNTDDEPDHLPQGAPTSPIISNMICHSLDHALVGLARDHGVFYTRYADDLTFSTNRRPFPDALAVGYEGGVLHLGPALVEIVEDQNGFTLNRGKSRLFSRSTRQAVTGLTVNRRANLKRAFVRELRGILHAWHKYGYRNAESEYRRRSSSDASLLLTVRGKLAFLKQIRGVDDNIFRRLYGRARELAPESFAELAPLAPAISLQVAAAEYPAIVTSDPKELRREYLSRMVGSAEGTLWIIDPFLQRGILRFLQNMKSPIRAQDIRLLSRDPLADRHLDEYHACVERFRGSGHRIEWRSSGTKLFHDRWLLDDHTCVSIGGPFNNITDTDNPPYGQNVVVRRPDQFDRWWSESTPTRGGARPAQAQD